MDQNRLQESTMKAAKKTMELTRSAMEHTQKTLEKTQELSRFAAENQKNCVHRQQKPTESELLWEELPGRACCWEAQFGCVSESLRMPPGH
mgnify:CR=1 FL=1